MPKGKRPLLLTRGAGGTDGYRDGGNLYRRLKNEEEGYGYDQLSFRFYMKFNAERDREQVLSVAARPEDLPAVRRRRHQNTDGVAKRLSESTPTDD